MPSPTAQPHPADDNCRIRVALNRDHRRSITLTVADNGVGLPPDFDWTSAKTLGLVLVRMLGQHQLGGRLRSSISRRELVLPLPSPFEREQNQ